MAAAGLGFGDLGWWGFFVSGGAGFGGGVWEQTRCQATQVVVAARSSR
jgi:hypothetical protein